MQTLYYSKEAGLTRYLPTGPSPIGRDVAHFVGHFVVEPPQPEVVLGRIERQLQVGVAVIVHLGRGGGGGQLPTAASRRHFCSAPCTFEWQAGLT